MHVFLCFSKVDVSRARDDRTLGPETLANSKRPEVVVSLRRNTCLCEAIIFSSNSMLSLPSPFQNAGGRYPSRGGYSDRFLKLGSKTGFRGCSEEGVWFWAHMAISALAILWCLKNIVSYPRDDTFPNGFALSPHFSSSAIGLS